MNEELTTALLNIAIMLIGIILFYLLYKLNQRTDRKQNEKTKNNKHTI